MSRVSVRSLQKVGNASYSLVLPKDWVERLGLGPRSSVIVEERGWELVVSPGPERSKRPIRYYEIIAGPEMERDMAIKLLLSAYLAGADLISVTSEERPLTAELKGALKDAVSRYTIGFEVVEDSRQRVSFQELAGSPTIGYGDLLKRMYGITDEMLKNAFRAVKDSDEDSARFVADSDSDVDKFYLYGTRAITISLRDSYAASRFGVEMPEELIAIKSTLKSIERIADHAVAISEFCRGIRWVPQELDDLEEKAMAAFGLAYRANMDLDLESASSVFSIAGWARGLKGDGELALLKEHMRRVIEYSADIAENVIDIIAIKGLRQVHGQAAKAY